MFFEHFDEVLFRVSPATERPNKFLLESLTYYISDVFIPENALFFLFIFFLGLLSFLRRQNDKPFFLSWFLLPLVALSLFTTKRPRYLVPILPAFALISSAGIIQIRQKWFKGAALLLVIGFSLFQFFTISCRNSNPLFLSAKDPYIQQRGDFKIRELACFLRPFLSESKQVFIFADEISYEFSLSARDLYVLLLLMTDFSFSSYIQTSENNSSCLDGFLQSLRDKEYDIFIFISRSAETTWPDPDGIRIHRDYFEEPVDFSFENKEIVKDAKREFTFIDALNLPEGQSINIWQRKIGLQ